MNIAIIGSPQGGGGRSTHVRELSAHVRKRGHRVTILPPSGLTPIAAVLQNLANLTGGLDIVHVHHLANIAALFSGSIAGKTFVKGAVCTAHGPGIHYWRSSQHRYLAWRAALRGFDSIISVSNHVREQMSELVGVNPPRHYTIYNGVDVNHFKPVDDVESVRKILGLANRTVVLYVGRLTRSKGLEYLIRCIPEVRREIRNLTLVICGKGESREPLAKEVSTLGLQDIVEFRGEVSEQLLPLYYGASNVVVLPSLFEAMPIVLLEAMSMARPLVASNVGGVPEVVQDGVTGLLVPPQDPSALARAIVTVGADGELARNLGANGQKLVEEKFTWDSVADQTLRVYGTTLGC